MWKSFRLPEGGNVFGPDQHLAFRPDLFHQLDAPVFASAKIE
jgi:hypothetical protein